jgi:hypothetical protein
MARVNGTFSTSFNFEPKIKGTLDARSYVNTYADLLSFTSQHYIPFGFVVACAGNDDPARRGLWMCINDSDLANPDSWSRVAGSLPMNGLISTGGISVTEEEVIINAPTVWDIGGRTFQTDLDLSFPVEPAADGYHKIGVLYGRGDSTIGIVYGPEAQGSAIEPQLPDGTARIAPIFIHGAAVEPPQPDLSGYARLSADNHFTGINAFSGQTSFNGQTEFNQQVEFNQGLDVHGLTTKSYTFLGDKIGYFSISNAVRLYVENPAGARNNWVFMTYSPGINDPSREMLIHLRGESGVMAFLKDIEDLDDTVLHKAGDEVKSGSLTADSLIKQGGTAHEVLMADGSSQPAIHMFTYTTTVVDATADYVIPHNLPYTPQMVVVHPASSTAIALDNLSTGAAQFPWARVDGPNVIISYNYNVWAQGHLAPFVGESISWTILVK